jgi:hypothetical protein
MLQQSIKVSLIAVNGVSLIAVHVCRLNVTYCSKRAQIEVMKTEAMKYQALADSIKSSEERKDNQGKDAFDLSDWWKSNSVQHYQYSRTCCVQC